MKKERPTRFSSLWNWKRVSGSVPEATVEELSSTASREMLNFSEKKDMHNNLVKIEHHKLRNCLL